MDEIFGTCYKVAQFTWKSREKPTNAGNSKFRPQKVAEYVLCYTNTDPELLLFDLSSGESRIYPHTDDVGRYRTTTVLTSNRGGFKRETMRTELPNGYKPNEEQRWKYGENEILKLYEGKRILFNNENPLLKVYEDDENELLYPLYTFMDTSLTSTAESGKKELNSIIGSFHGFDTVKPVNLIKYLVSIFRNKNSLILDAFAGTGTTSQAVLEQNAEDEGNRKYILIQQPEALTEGSPAYEAGFKTVDDITRERIRRVIDGVPTAKDTQLKEGLGGSFTAVTLGQAMHLQELATLPESELPPRDALASWVFYNTTLQALPKVLAPNATHCIGETDTHTVHLLYEANLAFLRSSAGAFTLGLAERIAEQANGNGKEAIVYAPMSFVDVKTIRQNKWKIRYCNLPYELLQVEAVKPPSTEAIM